MSERGFKLVGVVAPFLLCTVVPTIIFGLAIGQWGTNIVWGHVFGFGWFVAQSYFGPEHWRTAADIGIFVWPPIVLILLWFLSGRIWRSGTWQQSAFLCFLAATSLTSVPAQAIERFYVGRGVPADFNVLWNAI